MKEVEPRFKDQGDCGCGCGAFGTYRVKPWRNGVRCVRNCDKGKCFNCRGAANKRKGQRKQAKAVTALGIPRSSLHPGHEEFLGGSVRVEVKSGRLANRVEAVYAPSEAQSEVSRSIGDVRPFVAVFMPDGTSDGIFAGRLSTLHEFVTAMVEQWGAA